MKTYQYTDESGTVVHVIDEDGISRMSMLASVLPDDATIEPYVAPPAPPAQPSQDDIIAALSARLAALEANQTT